jgi:hypothetical protein
MRHSLRTRDEQVERSITYCGSRTMAMENLGGRCASSCGVALSLSAEAEAGNVAIRIGLAHHNHKSCGGGVQC